MGLGSKRFWRSVAEIGLAVIPGGGVAVGVGKAVGGLVLSEFLKPDSEEQLRFKAWVAVAETLESNDNLTNEQKWQALVGRVTTDLELYYGEAPKSYDVMFNASAALKEARGEFVEN